MRVRVCPRSLWPHGPLSLLGAADHELCERFLRVVLAAAAAEEAKARPGFLDEWKRAFPAGFALSNAGISCVDVSERGVFSLRCVNAQIDR